jgi:hypothetical protein
MSTTMLMLMPTTMLMLVESQPHRRAQCCVLDERRWIYDEGWVFWVYWSKVQRQRVHTLP